jgi:hypothetical protein
LDSFASQIDAKEGKMDANLEGMKTEIRTNQEKMEATIHPSCPS